MSFDPREHRSDTETCPGCGRLKNPDFRPVPCAHAGCTALGCNTCMEPCKSGAHEGRYCPEHLYLVELYPGGLVLGCEECRDAMEGQETNCASGYHVYRLISLGPEGTDEGAEYRCEGCGSTDPEGDSARA